MFAHTDGRRSNESNTRKNGVKVVVAFDWIRLDLGNSRGLTANRSGGTAKGSVPDHVTTAWFAVVDGKDGRKGTLIERINAFADDLSTLWPDWNAGPDLSRLTLGSRHPFKEGKRKPVVDVEVVELPRRRGGHFTVRFPDGRRVLMPADLILGGGFPSP